MNKYPYTHFEILTQLEDTINKLEANKRAFDERLKNIESENQTNDFYQSQKHNVNQIIDSLDTIAAELGAVDWI